MTDLSAFIFYSQRVGREAETERKTERGREREKERNQPCIWGICWMLTSQPPEMDQNGGIRVSLWLVHTSHETTETMPFVLIQSSQATF